MLSPLSDYVVRELVYIIHEIQVNVTIANATRIRAVSACRLLLTCLSEERSIEKIVSLAGHCWKGRLLAEYTLDETRTRSPPWKLEILPHDVSPAPSLRHFRDPALNAVRA